MAALAGLTLSAAAQTGDDGADDADPQGRIIARIQDRTDDDGVDDYRIEFGFFPQWAMEDKDPWAEAITTWSDWLPRARYLTKTVIDRRDADDNRRWLRSSLISVPASAPAQQDGSPDADFEGGGDDQQDLIEGRVVARYNPDSRGRLRVEFGFLPEWAFSRTANTEEAVEQYGEDLLPRARYLSASMIESRRGVWLRSSVVDVPSSPPAGCAINITSSPVSVVRDEENENRRIGTVECKITEELNAISVTGTPSGLTISPVPAGTDRWNLTLSDAATADAGSYPVEITVRPVQGDPVSESVTIRVTTGPLKPVIVNWEGYDSDEIAVLGDDPPSTENLTVVDAESDQPVSPRPRITYEVDEAAEEVCDVNRNNGRITPLTAGVCIVVARSAETDQYAAGESDPVRVTITRVDPDLRWDGYEEEDLRPGGDPVRPREPQPRLSEARGELTYTYSATPSSICAVNSRTGDLTLHREGECDVTVRSAQTDKFRADEVTVTVQSDPPGPECNRPIPDVGPLEPGQISRQINLDTYCDGEDLRYEVRSDNPTVASVRRIGSALTVTADDAPTDDRTEIIVTVTDRGGRGQSTEVRFDVLVEPVRPPEVLNVNCSPSRAEVNENVTCTVSLARNGGMPDTYSWSGGNSRGPSNNERYITTFDEAGRQPVDLTVRNAAGSDRGSTTVIVTEPPPEIIRVICPSSADVGEDITCTALLRGGEPDDWDWSGGDARGSSETYDTSFSSPGTKTVQLRVSNSAGSDSDSARVRVQQPPPRIDSISCSPSRPDVDENVTCTARLSGGDPDTYSWSGGDSSSSSTTYRTSFSSSGDKTVQLTVRNSAGNDSASTRVTVPEPPPPPINISCSPLSADVGESITCTMNNRGGEIVSYSWSDSDGGSGSSSTYRTSFSTPGRKTIRLTARNSAGSGSDSATVTVTGPPVISSIGCPASAAVNANITCTVVSNSGGAIDSYSWTDSDGGSGSSSSYRTSFSTPGRKTIQLTARNTAGSDSGSASVNVIAAPVINSINCPSSAAVDENITCTVSLSGGTPTSYSWSGGASSGSSASYRTSFSSVGSQTVRLTVSNTAGDDSGSTSVNVPATPVAPTINSISCTPSSPTVNQSVSCSASLSGGAPTSYSWSDSDGGSSSGPSETTYRTSFSSSGSKTVSLRVSNSAGSDSDSTSLPVPPPPPVVNSVSCSPSPARVNQSVTCTASLSGGTPTSYSWSGGSSSGSSASYRTSFSSAGTKTVSLTARNSAGSDSDSTSVNVVAGPTINSISCSPSSPTVNQSVTCTASLSGGAPTSYSWSGGSSSGGSSASYSTSFSSSGSKTISLTVRNSAGSDSDSTSLTVPPRPPVISISCSPSSINEGDRTRCSVSNSGGSISTYSWSASGGSPSSGSSSTYRPRFNTAGTYTVSLTASNSGGSDSDTYRSITVTVPPPNISIRCTAYAEQNETVSCTVRNRGGAISTYSWSGGSSSSRSGSSYSTRFSSFGSQTVYLTASNAGGSDSDDLPVDILATPPSTQYARCVGDTIRVYYFERSTHQRRHLNMTWAEAQARIPNWGESLIGSLSGSACNSWPVGPDITIHNWSQVRP